MTDIGDAFFPELMTSNAESILVVDDDPDIRELVSFKLSQAGYQVMAVESGMAALNLIEQRGFPHLAIVDIFMPGMSGLEFCEEVQKYSDLPVVMLTANADLATIIESIEYYAEDYITKPFKLNELLVRVRRVLRRVGDTGYALSPIQRVDDHLSINISAQRVIVDGEEKHLTPTESKLLYILLRNRGHIVTTDFLLKRLWPQDEVFEDALRVHIHRLRQKIESPGPAIRYIITERGQGYRFVKIKTRSGVRSG
jgi:DNA-binding response OmpR family regulator